jgi:hypothetical protein
MKDAEWERRLAAVEAAIANAKPATLEIIVDGDPEGAKRLRAERPDDPTQVKLSVTQCPTAEEYRLYAEDHRRRARLAAGPGRYVIAATQPLLPPERGR